MAATKRTGLGRGIGALIPGGEESDRPVDALFAPPALAGVADSSRCPAHSWRISHLRTSHPTASSPGRSSGKEDLDELVVSIREFGVLQPVVVRPIAGTTPGSAALRAHHGERRLRASQLAGRETIPAVIKNTADEDMLRDALLENLHRADLNPLEEASAYQQLLADFGITQDQLGVADRLPRPQITNTLRLLRLPETVQRRVAAGVLSAGHARAILSGVGDVAHMERLADKIVNEDLGARRGGSCRHGRRVEDPERQAVEGPAPGPAG